MSKTSEVLEGVLSEFMKLAAIPRQSGNEEAVSNFLKDDLAASGFRVQQDESFNLIIDAPASPGFEKAPLTVLQCHMDMVCVAEEGYAYNPLTDAIKVKRDSKYLTAEGTSLGADDGIGVAEGIYLLKHAGEHGPLRLIITVDEERGMTGAINLDEKHLREAEFLINCDSENWDELTVGSAGSVNLDFERRIKKIAPVLPHAYCLELQGLCGGHSGERIGDGRANALRVMALFLLDLQKKGHLELESFTGGKARNAIPDSARAVIVTELAENEVKALLKEAGGKLRLVYGSVEPQAEFRLCPAEMPAKVLTAGDTQRLLRLLVLLHTGVYAMSTAIPGLVETSANLGVLEMSGTKVMLQFFPRSAVDQKLVEFRQQAEELAALTGFKLLPGTQSPGWKENKSSRLAKLMAETFEEQNGQPMKVGAIHAGLECGWHFLKNPKLDIVSIGVTTLDIHSPKERLVLSTVEPQVRLIEETLRKIARLKN